MRSILLLILCKRCVVMCNVGSILMCVCSAAMSDLNDSVSSQPVPRNRLVSFVSFM